MSRATRSRRSGSSAERPGREPACSWACSALLLAGCAGAQSALAPAGRSAERIASLFWWMTAGGALVWLAVVGLGVYAVRAAPAALDRRRQALLIIGGGALVPAVVLAVLLV